MRSEQQLWRDLGCHTRFGKFVTFAQMDRESKQVLPCSDCDQLYSWFYLMEALETAN